MRRTPPIHYFPFHSAAVLVLLVVVAFMLLLIEIHAIEYAYQRIGMSPRSATAFLIFCLLGSYVNIPIRRYPDDPVVAHETVVAFGMRWRVPVTARSRGTIVAVNLGGAIAPTVWALRLMALENLWFQAAVAIVLVAAVVHAFARAVPGVGISVPLLVPPIAAAVIASVLSSRLAPALAFCAGTLGTLIGADLTNLHRVRTLGAPLVSIGGAGTFDGIFLTGVLAVLLA